MPFNFAVGAFKVLLLLLLLATLSNATTEVPVNNCSGDWLVNTAQNITNGTLVTINCSNISLTTPVKFADLQDITIDGQRVTFTCLDDAEAGLAFINIKQLKISNFFIVNCGMWSNASVGNELNLYRTPTRSAVLIAGGTGLQFTNISVTNSTGTGLSLLETTGNVTINRSVFADNTVKPTHVGYAGLHLELSGSKSQYSKNFYIIEQCNFSRNTALNYTEVNEYREKRMKKEKPDAGIGGGFGFILSNKATENQIIIRNSIFDSNIALNNGGGLRLLMLHSLSNNTVIITGSNFSENKCSGCGGGGASITWQKHSMHYNTTVNITLCLFRQNQAMFGGGVSVLIAKNGQHRSTNLVAFTNVTWEKNMAIYGAAVDVRPMHWFWCRQDQCYEPNVTFSDCRVLNNILCKSYISGNDALMGVSDCSNISSKSMVFTSNKGAESYITGIGALHVSDCSIIFSKSMTFVSNTGGALIAQNAILKIVSGSTLKFDNNTGSNGGAMILHHSSWVKVVGEENGTVWVSFTNNTAFYNGGALHVYYTDEEEMALSQSCFLQCSNRQTIITYFRNNSAGASTHFRRNNTDQVRNRQGNGDIIYATTFKPCFHECCFNNYSNDDDTYDYFNFTCNQCIITVNASTQSSDPMVHRASTKPSVLHFFGDDPIKIIPGKETYLNLSAKDDLNQEITTIYWATVVKGIHHVKLDKNFAQVSNSFIKMYGEPCSNGTVSLEAYGVLGITISINIKMDFCPPGYVLEHTALGKSCVCGARYGHKSHKHYDAIMYCNESDFTAKLSAGMWAGYIDTNFSTALCPRGYCKNIQDVFLPPTASGNETEKLICIQSRRGHLCGECISNETTAFHSPTFACVSTKLCNWGPLFYLLSEILPLTVLFLTITFFGIDFTTGGINSIILFAQIQPLLAFSKANPNVLYDFQPVEVLYHAYKVIYGFFNLEFFNIDLFAFCLWNGANPLDMLSIRYVSTLYALILVIGMVAFLNYCSCCIFWHKLMVWRRHKGFSSSIVHGIVAFLLLCYAQCVEVTIGILTPSNVYGKDGKVEHLWVYYYATFDYMSRQHLAYAIPALVVLVTFVLIPPILLMSYPLCYRVMAVLHVSETKVGVRLTRWIEKLKPLLDAFQSPFKDNYQFIAGVYFLYRVVALTAFAFQTNLITYYVIMEVLLIVSLLFHSIAQPYRKLKDNMYHALVVANLAIITGLYLYNYVRTRRTTRSTAQETFVTAILLILIYLPLVCALGYLAIKFCYKIRVFMKTPAHATIDFENENHEFPARMMEENTRAQCNKYKYMPIND